MPPSTNAQGIDVSRYQGAVNWEAVRSAGIAFAIVKATESTNVVDPTFAANWAALARSGLVRSAYHFFRPTLDPKKQAAHFVKTVSPADGGLPLVLDVETDGGLDKAGLINSVYACLTELERLTGRKSILYTGPSFWNTRMLNPNPPAWTADYPLWIANYTTAAQPVVPKGWTRWTFWQYTDRGKVDGIGGNVDRNVFNGTEAELRAWAQPGAAPVDSAEPEIPEAILLYFQALNSGSLDTLAGLYLPEASLVAAPRVETSPAAIRDYFTDLVQTRLAGGAFNLGDVQRAGASWRFAWTCQAAGCAVTDGDDTVFVRDGKILYHSTTFTITPK